LRVYRYTQATTAYTATRKAFVLKAEADNAAVRLEAEAFLQEQEAGIALQTARNGAQRARSEADLVEAEAAKIAAEAKTAKAQAANQEDKARELTATTLAEVQLQKAKTIGKVAELRNLGTRAKAEVEKAEVDNVNAICTERMALNVRLLSRQGMANVQKAAQATMELHAKADRGSGPNPRAAVGDYLYIARIEQGKLGPLRAALLEMRAHNLERAGPWAFAEITLFRRQTRDDRANPLARRAIMQRHKTRSENKKQKPSQDPERPSSYRLLSWQRGARR
jgi:hypothetical protein